MDAHQTNILTAVIVSSCMLGLLIFFFVISMIRQHRRNIELYRSKIKAEISTLENERTRVSADLHDELGPLLFTIKFKLSSIEADEDGNQMVEEANTHIDDVIQRIRDISNDLMPGTLLRKGVVYALEEFIDRTAKTTNIKITLHHESVGELSKEICINLYRIVLEVIHNTLKHSRASYLRIDLHRSGDTIILDTEDDGIGFDQKVQ